MNIKLSLAVKTTAIIQRLQALPKWVWGIGVVITTIVFMFTWAMPVQKTVDAPAAVDVGAVTVESPAVLTLSIVWKLGLTILLIYVSLYLLRRWQTSGMGRLLPWKGREKQIELVETLRLSPRQALHLVRVGHQVLLIGATEQALAMLAEVALPEGDVLPATSDVEPTSELVSQLSSFKQVLSQTL